MHVQWHLSWTPARKSFHKDSGVPHNPQFHSFKAVKLWFMGYSWMKQLPGGHNIMVVKQSKVYVLMPEEFITYHSHLRFSFFFLCVNPMTSWRDLQYHINYSLKCYPGGQKIHLTSSISEIPSEVLPLCSVYQAPSNKPNLTLLAWYLPDLAYLSMLFILEIVCTADHLKNK